MRFLKNNSGLTLIETVIALSLIVILTTAFVGALSTGLKSETEMNNRKSAIEFGSSIIDIFKFSSPDYKNLLTEIIDKKNYSLNESNINFNDIKTYFPEEFIDKSDQYITKINYEEIKENLLELSINLSWENNGKNYNEKIVTLVVVGSND